MPLIRRRCFHLPRRRGYCLATGLAMGWMVGAATVSAAATVPGDCDGNGMVTINELVTGVNIALGTVPVSDCPAFDQDDSGTVTITELIAAVDAAFGGGASTPTSTPLSPTPTPTRAAPSTLTATVTVVPTATMQPTQPIFRQADVALASAQQAALSTAADLTWLDAGVAAGDPPTGIAGGSAQVCPAGGQVVVSCTVTGAAATRTIAYTSCRAPASASGADVLVRDGMVTQTVADPTFCQRDGIEASDTAMIVYAGYREQEVTPSQAVVLDVQLDLTTHVQPAARTGCAGPDRDQTLGGSVVFACTAGSESVACPAAGIDLTLTVTALDLMRTSSGAPCVQGVIATGGLRIQDRMRGDDFTQQFQGLAIGRSSGTASDSQTLTVDGQTTIACFGAMVFTTAETDPLQLPMGATCATGGTLSVVNAPPGGSSTTSPTDFRRHWLNVQSAVQDTGATPTATPIAVPADAEFRHQLFRAADGRVYQVLQNAGVDLTLGADALQITTVVGAVDGSVGECANAAGLTSKPQAVVAAEPPSADTPGEVIAVPLDAVVKSPLIGDASPPCFNRNANNDDGRICIGPGCTADCACLDATACVTFAGQDGQPIANATTVNGAVTVPAAELVSSLPDLQPPCIGFAGRSTYRFGSTGPTVETDQCAAAPADGFALPYAATCFGGGTAGSTMVFAYDTTPLTTVNVGAAGFPIDTNGDSICTGPGKVLSLGQATFDQIRNPPSSHFTPAGVAQDYDGDGQTDATLPSCMVQPLRPCDMSPTPTPGPTPPCGAILLDSDNKTPVVGTTVGATDLVKDIECGWTGGGAGAPDVTYEFTAPDAARYSVAVQGAANFDPLLAVRRDQCQGAALACNYDSENTHSPSLTVDLAQNERVAIVVDGAGTGQQGQFTLQVMCDEPDLVVRLHNPPTTGCAGQPVVVAADVSNIGDVDATPFSVEFTLGGSKVDFRMTNGLPAHASTLVDLPPLIAPEQGGTYSMSVVVDPENERSECRKDNNTDISQFTIPVPGIKLDQQLFRAVDGSAYQVLRVLQTCNPTSEGHYDLTTLAGAASGIGICKRLQGMSGGLSEAIAGALFLVETLHPYGQIIRTGIVEIGPDPNIAFDERFGGRVTLGSDVSAANICKSPFDCTGYPSVQSVMGLDSDTGGVPASCIANGVSAGSQCDGTNTREVFGFGIAATGSPPICNDPAQVTADTTICAPEPGDGFRLGMGQALIVIYDSSLLGDGFSVGVAGFGIGDNGISPAGCQPGTVVNVLALQADAPAPPLPTNTPTATPTETPTNTPTATPTITGAASVI